MPVSVRSANAFGQTGSQVSLMLPFLPIDQEDPAEQLRLVHRRLSRAKTSGQRQAGSVLRVGRQSHPIHVVRLDGSKVLTRLPQRGVVALATNVPGPRKPLQIMGRNVVHLLPIPPIALQLRTGIAILSYANELAFGITADFDAAPDVEELSVASNTGWRAWSRSAMNDWDRTPPPDRRSPIVGHDSRATMTGIRAPATE